MLRRGLRAINLTWSKGWFLLWEVRWYRKLSWHHYPSVGFIMHGTKQDFFGWVEYGGWG